MPATVVLLAGQTTATFSLTTVDDRVIETTPTPVTVTAHVENWTDGVGTVNLLDDDQTLAVVLPASTWEGQQNSGTVQIGGASTSPVVVSLASGKTSELTVPPSVTIPAGQTSATFTFTAVQNSLHQGPQSVVVTGTATGLPQCAAAASLGRQPGPFRSKSLPARRRTACRSGVTIQACDVLNNLIFTYSGTSLAHRLGQAVAFDYSRVDHVLCGRVVGKRHRQRGGPRRDVARR